MKINKIILKNWKNFLFIEQPVGDRLFVVGANASGKSNFLDVFRFLRDIVKQSGGLQPAVEQRGGVSKIRCLFARRAADVSIDIYFTEESDDNNSENSDWRYYLSFKHGGGGIVESYTEVIEEKVWNKKKGWLLERSGQNSDEDQETRKFTHLEQVTVNKKFRPIYECLQKINYLNIIPQLVREADSYILSVGKEDFYGRNLLDRVTKLNESTRKAYIKYIREILEIAVPQLTDFDITKDDSGKTHFQVRCQHWRPKGAWQQEDQFSDGTLRIIGFLWAMLDGTGILLLEEPELYLHSSIVKQIAEFISIMQNKKDKVRQVFLTSHGYDLLDNQSIGLDEVFIISTAGEASEIKRASEMPNIVRSVESGISLAEACIGETTPLNINNLVMS